MWIARLDLEHRYGVSVAIRVGLRARQSLERLAQRGYVAGFGVEITEHVIKGSVLQHHHNDVVDRV